MSLITIADAGAEVTTKRLFHEIQQIGEKFPDQVEEQQTWLKTMEDLLKFCLKEEDGFAKGQIILLHYIEKCWSELPEETRKIYKDSFWNYAEVRTGKDRATIANHLRAIRAFFIDGVGPNHSLQLPERDDHKRPVKSEDGGIAIKVVPWNPVTVPISKLVAITAKATSGKMTDKLWTMAQDNGVTWEQLQLEMATKGSGGDPNMIFIIDGAELIVKEGEDEAHLGSFSVWDEYYSNQNCLSTRAMRRLISLLGIMMDEEALRLADIKNRTDEVYGADYKNG